MHRRLIPTGRLENRHTLDGLGIAPAGFCFDRRAAAYLLRPGPLGGTARSFTLRHQYPPCPRPTHWRTALIKFGACEEFRIRTLRIFNRNRMRPWLSRLERSAPRIGPFGRQKRLGKPLKRCLNDLSSGSTHNLTRAAADTYLRLLQFWRAHKHAGRLGPDHLRVKEKLCVFNKLPQNPPILAGNKSVTSGISKRHRGGRGLGHRVDKRRHVGGNALALLAGIVEIAGIRSGAAVSISRARRPFR